MVEDYLYYLKIRIACYFSIPTLLIIQLTKAEVGISNFKATKKELLDYFD